MKRTLPSIVSEINDAKGVHLQYAPTNPHGCEVKMCNDDCIFHLDADERTFRLCNDHCEELAAYVDRMDLDKCLERLSIPE